MLGNCQEDYIRTFAKEVFNFNDAVIRGFDEQDLNIIKNTFSFRLWYLLRRLHESIFGR